MSIQDDGRVRISRKDFAIMLTFARLLHRLTQQEEYVRALEPRLPPAARFQPPNDSILMGYDFHLSASGPKLIEVNNNAAGLYWQEIGWLPQPQIPELSGKLEQRLVAMFDPAWRHIAIMDEHVTQQFMYPEMLAYARLLQADGRHVVVVNPEDLTADDGGSLRYKEQRLDAIYNRHTDFYLESPALAHVRRAYLEGKVMLTPNPRSYGLIGDKGRMVDWWHEGLLERCLSPDEVGLIRTVVPEIHVMAEMERERLWRERRDWVFKPMARHGGKGVMPGKSMGRKRFAAMDPETTVVQRYVPPGQVRLHGENFNFDVRLYMHGDALIAVAARVWQGLVMNFRDPGSGFLPLVVAD